jgi:hypothetical protein
MSTFLSTVQWSTEIQRELFEAQDYTSMSKNYSTMVNNTSFVLPESGSIEAQVDNYSRPLVATTRTDSGKTISMFGINTLPYYIQLDEQFELSYDKRSSISQHLVSSIDDLRKQKILYSWFSDVKWSGNSVKTSGLSGSTLPTGSTGARKRLTYTDICKANTILDLQNVPSDGRVMLIHSAQYQDVKLMSEFVENQVYTTDLLKQGVVGMIDGILIKKINSNKVLVNAVGSGSTSSMGTFGATGSTYSFGALVYHPDFVCRVVGNTELFVNQKDALYTSDILTMTTRLGGGLVRNDQVGAVAIVQEIA